MLRLDRTSFSRQTCRSTGDAQLPPRKLLRGRRAAQRVHALRDSDAEAAVKVRIALHIHAVTLQTDSLALTFVDSSVHCCACHRYARHCHACIDAR
jgi:hypothetical protein